MFWSPGRVHAKALQIISSHNERSRFLSTEPTLEKTGEIIVSTQKGVVNVQTPRFKKFLWMVRSLNFGQPTITVTHAPQAEEEAEKIVKALEKQTKWRVKLVLASIA